MPRRTCQTQPSCSRLATAITRIHKASRGLPRAVNNLAVQALIAAYANNAAIVDDKAARAAVTEVNAE